MYEEHLVLARPREDEVIWRFMDLSKLLYILSQEALPFVRLDLFEDKFEGYVPQGNVIVAANLTDIPPDQQVPTAEKLNKNTRNLARLARQIIFVNCWHINEHESAAMWKLYLQSSEGVAIRSTFGRLKKSMRNAHQSIEVGKVEYLDYQTARVETAIMDMMALSMRKRKSFEHEQELRAIHWDRTESMDIITGWRPKNSKEMIPISVHLDTLIESVFVAPSSLPSYKTLVKSVVEKYGFNKPVQQSSLAEDPIW
ncbi:MAG: hypothetical protein ABSD44_14555 [Terracidiphilus sp.]